MCKQHLVEASQEQEKAVVPEIEIHSCEEPFTEVSKMTRLYAAVLQTATFQDREILHAVHATKQQRHCLIYNALHKMSSQVYLPSHMFISLFSKDVLRSISFIFVIGKRAKSENRMQYWNRKRQPKRVLQEHCQLHA